MCDGSAVCGLEGHGGGCTHDGRSPTREEAEHAGDGDKSVLSIIYSNRYVVVHICRHQRNASRLRSINGSFSTSKRAKRHLTHKDVPGNEPRCFRTDGPFLRRV